MPPPPARPARIGRRLIEACCPAGGQSAHPNHSGGADVWSRIPVAQNSVAMALDVFAPRNPRELRRTLRDDAALLVVTPAPAHPAKLRQPLALLDIDRRKDECLADAFAPFFRCHVQESLTWRMELNRDDVTSLPRCCLPRATRTLRRLRSALPYSPFRPQSPAPSCSGYTAQSDWRATSSSASHTATASPQSFIGPPYARCAGFSVHFPSSPQPSSLHLLFRSRTQSSSSSSNPQKPLNSGDIRKSA